MKPHADANLVLEDGSCYRGRRLGADTETVGEVVFNTSMTGYQEMLTDPSYKGQILLLTYPLIGNYGVNERFTESKRIQASGLIVRSASSTPSHNGSRATLDDYLVNNGIAGVSEIDTRAVARKLRIDGVMMGIITPREDANAALEVLKSSARYEKRKLVEASGDTGTAGTSGKFKVALYDYGVKRNIVRLLQQRGCDVTVLPCSDLSDPPDHGNYDGIVISPGPGDPAHEQIPQASARQLLESGIPTFGICLGHQVLARALGATTYKLKFGHRGGNQPVIDLKTGKVHVSAHNHGYAVDEAGLPPEVEVTHRNLNDGTVEGMRHKTHPFFTIQYHPEAAPGPNDAEYMFDQLVEMMSARRAHAGK